MMQTLVHRCSWALSLALLLACPSQAATGLNLAWGHCYGEGTGMRNASFACDTNTGNHVLVGSFVVGATIQDMTALEFDIQIATASTELPAWWSLYEVGNCRSGAPGFNFTADPNDAVCVDWGGGLESGTIFGYCTVESTSPYCQVYRPGLPARRNETVFSLGVTMALGFSATLDPGTEYFGFNVLINHTKTVGAGSCTGCETPACIALTETRVFAEATHMATFAGATSPGSNCITWQGGGSPSPGAAWGCPAATPVRRSAWGAVKALYR